MPKWTPRQPKIDYGPKDTIDDLSLLILGLADKHIESKKDKEETKLKLAVTRLDSLEQRRNRYEVAYLEKQSQIANYIGEADSLSDLYKTGKVQRITADMYEEPFKYYKQNMAKTEEQIKMLNPAVINSIDTLLKLSQAQNFLTKGVGATYTTGLTEEQKATWGPEDLTRELFMKKYYKDLGEGKSMPAPMETYFKKHELDPGVPESLELRRLEGVELRGRVASKQEQVRIKEVSTDRMNTYNPMINKSNLAMTSVNTYHVMEQQARSKDDQGSMEDAADRKRVEQFRLGLMLDPTQAMALGERDLDVEKINELSYDELEDIYNKNIEDKQKVGLVSSIQSLGGTIWQENLRGINPLDVDNRGVVVPPFNVRDELLAKAYSQYKDYMDGGLIGKAAVYKDNITRILGVDLALEGTVRNILREFFRKNYIEGLTGIEGGFDKLRNVDLSASEKGLYVKWMDKVNRNYGYDILNDKWIYDE